MDGFLEFLDDFVRRNRREIELLAEKHGVNPTEVKIKVENGTIYFDSDLSRTQPLTFVSGILDLMNEKYDYGEGELEGLDDFLNTES